MLNTAEKRKSFSKSFMDLVYQRIKHGDAEHQKWLKNECRKLEGSLFLLLETSTLEDPGSNRVPKSKTR